MIARIKAYFAGAKQEFKTIQWPNFPTTRRLTIVVIGISLLIAVILGAADYGFGVGLGKLLELQ